MTFYFKPPRGNIGLDKILDCVEQRLEFITSVSEHSESYRAPKNLNYFVDGTAIDRTSHFMLRLVSLEKHELQELVLFGETALFNKRIDCLNYKQSKLLLRTCNLHINEIIQARESTLGKKYLKFLNNVKSVFQDMLNKNEGLMQCFNNEITTENFEIFVKVNYSLCLKMISRRKIIINKGIGIIPCHLWKQLLSEIFYLHLIYGWQEMKHSGCHLEAFNDSRVSQLSTSLLYKFKLLDEFNYGPSTSTKSNIDYLKADDIKNKKILFPPCVLTMLANLFLNHRIGHHPRVTLTLILKECGLPVKEALKFWENELSKPENKHDKNHGSGCCHNWEKDHKKYIYSIRHMYGLEGGRKNYSGPSCCTMQSKIIAPNQTGGCPFVKLPEERLSNILNRYIKYSDSRTEILQLAHEDKPLKACQKLLNLFMKQSNKKCDENNAVNAAKFTKPSQYFINCNDWSNMF